MSEADYQRGRRGGDSRGVGDFADWEKGRSDRESEQRRAERSRRDEDYQTNIRHLLEATRGTKEHEVVVAEIRREMAFDAECTARHIQFLEDQRAKRKLEEAASAERVRQWGLIVSTVLGAVPGGLLGLWVGISKYDPNWSGMVNVSPEAGNMVVLAGVLGAVIGGLAGLLAARR